MLSGHGSGFSFTLEKSKPLPWKNYGNKPGREARYFFQGIFTPSFNMQVTLPPWRAVHRYNLGKILCTLCKIKPHQLRFACAKSCLNVLFFCLITKQEQHTETAAKLN